jgi:hypothetical protein
LLVAAATFGLCYLFDKGFQKHFRSKDQHRSGLAVRLNKMYSLAGLLLVLLGICAVMAGLPGNKTLLWGGIFVLLLGIALCTYHLSFGIFYDGDSFVYTNFSKKTRTYQFRDIQSQKLYSITGGSLVVELHLTNGEAVSIQTTMDGAYPFLDAAYQSWCRQRGINPESCKFHDPANHLWFPMEEN